MARVHLPRGSEGAHPLKFGLGKAPSACHFVP